jgi:hypothetical protein
MTRSELRAELLAAKQSNIGCILHAEGRRPAEPSVWAQPHEHRRTFIRSRCGRPRRLDG